MREWQNLEGIHSVLLSHRNRIYKKIKKDKIEDAADLFGVFHINYTVVLIYSGVYFSSSQNILFIRSLHISSMP